MKIGVISDTHIPSMGKEPPPQIIKAFEGVDLILHAGDVYIEDCIKWLERIAPVEATTSWASSTREAAPRVNHPIVVEAGGHSIGLVHQLFLDRLPDDILPGAIEKRLPPGESIPNDLEQIFGKPVDIVVFGYTHVPMVETHQGILMINPGSPTMVGQVMKTGSVAILEFKPEGPEAHIVPLADIRE